MSTLALEQRIARIIEKHATIRFEHGAGPHAIRARVFGLAAAHVIVQEFPQLSTPEAKP